MGFCLFEGIMKVRVRAYLQLNSLKEYNNHFKRPNSFLHITLRLKLKRYQKYREKNGQKGEICYKRKEERSAGKELGE